MCCRDLTQQLDIKQINEHITRPWSPATPAECLTYGGAIAVCYR